MNNPHPRPQANFSAFEIERLKRQAKSIEKSTGITHIQALDQLALEHGFPNWSWLAHKGTDKSLLPPGYKLRRTLAEMSTAMRSTGTGRDFPLENITNLENRFVSAQNAIQYAIDFMELALSVPRYSIHLSAPAWTEMRCHLPYRLHQTAIPGILLLVNRYYKPVGSNQSKIFASYEDATALHFRISEGDARAVSDPDHRSTFGLYGDGSTPWHSRTNAERYLRRLHQLMLVLTRKRV